jgi:ATP-dependent HslUV protease ATP-binding subunit HslU
MKTEDVTVTFTDDAIDALADIAVDLNATIENIGARRLQTVMERVLDDISFTAPDKAGEEFVIDGDYVRSQIGDLAQNADLSRYIL